MPKLTISGAARAAGLSRQYLYKAYIKTGKISVERDENGNPLIDTSELLRVFGRLQSSGDVVDVDTERLHEETGKDDTVIKVLTAELEAKEEIISRLERQVLAGEEREAWLRQQLERAQAVLTDQTHRKKPWWVFW